VYSSIVPIAAAALELARRQVGGGADGKFGSGNHAAT
jgi:hypothetical protein